MALQNVTIRGIGGRISAGEPVFRLVCLSIVLSPGNIFLFGEFQIGTVAIPHVVEDLFEKRDAPSASGPGTVTIRNLRGDLGLIQTNMLLDFLEGNVKADANIVVAIHKTIIASPGSGDKGWRDRLGGKSSREGGCGSNLIGGIAG